MCFLHFLYLLRCLSNADEDEIDDPNNKAVRERERRQANNVRERFVEKTSALTISTRLKTIHFLEHQPVLNFVVVFDNFSTLMILL